MSATTLILVLNLLSHTNTHISSIPNLSALLTAYIDSFPPKIKISLICHLAYFLSSKLIAMHSGIGFPLKDMCNVALELEIR